MKRSTVLRVLSWLCFILMPVVYFSLGIYVSGGPNLSFWLVTVPLLLIGLWLRKAANAAERREEGKGAKG